MKKKKKITKDPGKSRPQRTWVLRKKMEEDEGRWVGKEERWVGGVDERGQRWSKIAITFTDGGAYMHDDGVVGWGRRSGLH